MAYHDLSNLNHDRSLAAALGDMVVAWAEAESVLCATLARVTGMNINMCTMGYYRIPTFESRRKYLEALMAEWNAAPPSKPQPFRTMSKPSTRGSLACQSSSAGIL